MKKQSKKQAKTNVKMPKKRSKMPQEEICKAESSTSILEAIGTVIWIIAMFLMFLVYSYYKNLI